MKKVILFFAVIFLATTILTGCSQSQAERDAEKIAELGCKGRQLAGKLSSLDKSSEEYPSVAKKTKRVKAKIDSFKKVLEERYTESELKEVQKKGRKKVKDCE